MYIWKIRKFYKKELLELFDIGRTQLSLSVTIAKKSVNKFRNRKYLAEMN